MNDMNASLTLKSPGFHIFDGAGLRIEIRDETVSHQ